ncbi:TolC family outer membrane protein [Novosphingobium sp. JCM 18896]|nr:TolC family outer membrane protein [Novosphingobium sp. JCM 18896]MCW1429250.1 TolC family outer membrane protein [Novosphingobium sp. JCM 18896]
MAGAALAATLGAGPAWAPAQAEDLRSALIAAYNTNPTLQGARASQRATDEDVAIQKAPGRPSITGQATHTEFVKQSGNNFTAPDRNLNAQLSLSVPLYSGGSVRNGVKAAETRVEAGQADLRGTESSVFSQVVGAYMDVILNEAVVGLNRNNVQVLEVNLQATSDRFEIGDLTRTDVAQSQSRLALARGDARTAEANLVEARERYIRLVGQVPGMLEAPPPLPGLPASPEDAVTIAIDNNPDLAAAHERRKAAGYDVKVAGAGRLPTLSAFSQGTYNDYYGTLGGSLGSTQTFTQSETTAQVGLRASIPIFQGGRPAAQRRQAQAREGAAMEQEIEVERGVIAQVRSAYSSWQASNEIITSTQSAVDAAGLSLEGVRAENSVGNRTIIDILDAEQELLRARVQLVTARRNAYVAGFSLLAAMGQAEAQDLGLDGGPLYDPDVNYKRVRGKWFDWDDDAAPKPQSTRTVDTPPQDGEIRGSEATTIQSTNTNAPGGK